MIYEDFFTKGYVKGFYDNEESLKFFDQFEFQDARLIDRRPPAHCKDQLIEIANYFKDIHIGKVFVNVKLNIVSMWQSVDDLSSEWHNDRFYKKTGDNTWEGHRFNSNILLYLDENDEKIGNSIEITNGIEEFIEYPTRGEFVWINQSRECIKHKATHKQGTRRLLSFEYLISDLHEEGNVISGLEY